MDKISKFLTKLGSKERLRVDNAVEQILNRNFTNLDIKKLQGNSDTFRVRVGEIRIKFKLTKEKVIIRWVIKNNNARPRTNLNVE